MSDLFRPMGTVALLLMTQYCHVFTMDAAGGVEEERKPWGEWECVHCGKRDFGMLRIEGMVVCFGCKGNAAALETIEDDPESEQRRA